MYKIILNRDKELAEEAERQLKEMKEKYGERYCPCALEHSIDTICMCKAFREQDYPGECYCGKYEKIKIS